MSEVKNEVPPTGELERVVNQPMGRWMADYRCGCTNIQPTKRELLDYCGKHGEPRRMCIELPTPAPCGLVG